ncbi:hypothetical protein B0H65DRAFT_505360 [Neurospora tetraspora]|uniref:Uncharacterized protein n=1 Tax=Neurospora tetraspora TaxID=94610 RepID=A0AAE0MWZ5_9PEZI|nr:hypothetical protein B0H65DRAFT_505360 [Neurospora tetraspora]
MAASVDGRTFPSGAGTDSLVLLHAAVEPADAPISFHPPDRYTYLVLRSRSRTPCNCRDAVVEKAPLILIGAMVIKAIPKYRRSASLVGALATIWTQEKSHELLEVRGQQDWPAMAAQILIRANSKKANSKVRTINSLIFPAASRGPSRYTPHPGFHTTYHSLYTSATKRHQTGPDDVDLGFVFKPYDLLALPAGTRDVLYRENPACEGRYVQTHDKLHLSASKHSLITNYQARALVIFLPSRIRIPAYSHGWAG